ncbi:MAG: diaminopimelate decarboxylase [Candidatus Omnitrophica bacterium]|nr:diaminopimelate decarboxylase [Candidatus Omnitrophota bacterium]
MQHIHYKNNELYCENVAVKKIAERFGTPVYIYSQQAFIDRYKELKNAFTKITPLICYSVKACSNVAILRLLVKQGAGLDIVSGGELFRAARAKCPMARVVFAGVGKTPDEVSAAIRHKILFFNVESEPELARINAVARSLRRTVNIALRLNPDVESHTHHYITTAKKENKFGIDFASARRIFARQGKYPNVRIKGIHLHVGSQLTRVSPFVNALKKTMAFIDSLGTLCSIDTINIGGGVGIVYDQERTLSLKEYAAGIERIIVPRGYDLILEPGRFIAGNSGIFVTEVQYVKKTTGKRFLIVDGAMNDLVRPTLYQAYHEIVPVTKRRGRKALVYDIVGPICESGDFFAKKRKVQEMHPDELLALKSAGAYGFSMSSNYNSRGRAAEVLVSGTRAHPIRSREEYATLLKGEILPTHLK